MFKNNVFPRHNKKSLVNRHFSNLKVGGEGNPNNIVLDVSGNTSINGVLSSSSLEVTGSVSLPGLLSYGGVASNGRVLTTDDIGNVYAATKFFTTNDNPELPTGPSDGNINTIYNVGIALGITEPDEKLVVGSTNGDGARIGNMTMTQTSSSLSTITHSDLKGEPTSYSLQMDSSGLTQVNAKTDIEFSNNDTTNMTLTNIGDLGIGITPTVKLHVNGDSIIEGDLTVNGSLTTISSTNLEVSDSIIHLANGNTGNSIDIGFYGQYNTNSYSGLIRDSSSSNQYILFDNGDTEPSTFLSGTYDLGNLSINDLTLSSMTASSGINYNSGSMNVLSDGSIGVKVSPLVEMDIDGDSRVSGTMGINSYPVAEYTLYVNGTDAIKIPSGITGERPTIQVEGAMRYNTTDGLFEGWNGTKWANLSAESIYDTDRDTYITAEENPDDDTIRMFTGGTETFTFLPSVNFGIGVTTPSYSIEVNKTDAIKLPSGTTLQRPSAVGGLIRYNEDLDEYEGYDDNNSRWVSLSRLVDTDRNTYITVEETSDDNNIRFYNEGTESMTLTSTGNLGLGTSTPTVSVDFNKTDAMKIPSGLIGERPTGAAGLLRYNSSTTTFEGYTTKWESFIGLKDGDGDTYIDVEENSDEDKIRFYTSGTEKMIVDTGGNVGIGVATPSTKLDVGGTITADDLIVDNSATINGDLVVNGSLSTISSTNIEVSDILIKLGSDNILDSVDLGFYGQYVETGTTKYYGLFRDATDGKVKVFNDLEVEPTTTVNTSGTGYTKSILEVSQLDTNDIKHLSTDMLFKNSSDTTSLYLSNGGFLSVGDTSPSYPLHVKKSNTSNWSGRFTNGSTDVFIANDSVNGMLVDSGAANTNTSYALNVQSDLNNILYVENDGKIGVLTSTPGNRIDIDSTTTGDGIKSGIGFLGNASSTVMMVSHNNNAGVIASAALTQNTSGETSINSSSSQVINFKQNDSTIANFSTTSNFLLGTPSDSTKKLSVGGSTFIDDDLIVGTDTLQAFSSSGNVGVGTNNPSSTLDVSTTSGVRITSVGSTDTTEILGFYPALGATVNDHYWVQGYFSGGTYPHNITFRSKDTGVESDLITMTLDGNVGINNKSPTEKLDVSGNVKVSGDLQVDSNTFYINSTDNFIGIGTTGPDSSEKLSINVPTKITDSLTITGDLNVEGAVIEVLIIQDPLVKVANGNAADTFDIGVYGQYNDGASDKYTAMFRDATDGEYHLVTELTSEPTSTVGITTSTQYANLNINNLTAKGTVTCTEVITTSDIRAKKNINKTDLDYEKILDLDLYEYELLESNEKTYGLLAQDLEKVLPEAIYTTKKVVNGEVIDDFKMIKQNVLTAALFSLNKQLYKKINDLEKKIN